VPTATGFLAWLALLGSQKSIKATNSIIQDGLHGTRAIDNTDNFG